MNFKTKEYPDNPTDTIVNKVKVNYSQGDEDDELHDQNLTLKIVHQGSGFYFQMKTKKWSFENIDEIIKIFEDFKERANLPNEIKKELK